MKLIQVTNTQTGETVYFKTFLGAAKHVGKTTNRIKLLLGGFSNKIDGYEISETNEGIVNVEQISEL